MVRPMPGADRLRPDRRSVVGDVTRYGPHDPDAAPAWVTVLADVKWPPRTGVPVPIPAALVRQRETINRLATESPRDR